MCGAPCKSLCRSAGRSPQEVLQVRAPPVQIRAIDRVGMNVLSIHNSAEETIEPAVNSDAAREPGEALEASWLAAGKNRHSEPQRGTRTSSRIVTGFTLALCWQLFSRHSVLGSGVEPRPARAQALRRRTVGYPELATSASSPAAGGRDRDCVAGKHSSCSAGSKPKTAAKFTAEAKLAARKSCAPDSSPVAMQVLPLSGRWAKRRGRIGHCGAIFEWHLGHDSR